MQEQSGNTYSAIASKEVRKVQQTCMRDDNDGLYFRGLGQRLQAAFEGP